MENTKGTNSIDEATHKSVFYLTSDPSLVGLMKVVGINNDKCLRFFPNTIYPLDVCKLLRNTSDEELVRVLGHLPADNEYSLYRFLDSIQSQWKKVVVWRGNDVADEILMMLIAKFAPANNYPLYEVILDQHKLLSGQEIYYIEELDHNIEEMASWVSPLQKEALANRYDVLLQNDTGLRARNSAGEIVNVDLDYFVPTVFSVVDECAANHDSNIESVVLGLMQKQLSYDLSFGVLFMMKDKGLLHIKNKTTGEDYLNIEAFRENEGSSLENAVVVR